MSLCLHFGRNFEEHIKGLESQKGQDLKMIQRLVCSCGERLQGKPNSLVSDFGGSNQTQLFQTD
jgi:hypothetical protein